MQRLFSTFPAGWPGAGLLLLRLSAGLSLIVCGASAIVAGLLSTSLLAAAAAIVCGILLLVGLWTPIAASIGAILELWVVWTRAGVSGVPILLIAIFVSLVMLGPGAWSIDSRIFGLRRIVLRD